jgi:tripartite-type tricarboxylate transporter receptor subunit TctC
VIALALAFALSALVAGSARADGYPDRPVKIIVPFAAGGTANAIPRLVGDWLSHKWGQPVLSRTALGPLETSVPILSIIRTPTATRCFRHRRRRL